MKTIIEDKKVIVTFIAMFIFYLIISFLAPYAMDDWRWGVDDGIKSLFTADQNSRYAGNILVLALTRSEVFKAIIMAIFATIIPFLMTLLVGYQNSYEFFLYYLGSNVLMLLIPASLWAQTYGWASGFANYSTSLLFLLSHLVLIRRFLAKGPAKKIKVSSMMVLLSFSFVGQLFLENLTVFFTLLYLGALVSSVIRYKKMNIYLASGVVGTCVGNIVMFSSSIYQSLLAKGSAYGGFRELSVDISSGLKNNIIMIIKTFCYNYVISATLGLKFVSILILLFLSILLLLRKTKISTLMVVGNTGIVIIYLLVWFVGVFIPYRYKIAFAIFYYLVVTMELAYMACMKQICPMAVLLWIAIFGVLFPLAVTKTMEYRLLLAPITLTNVVILVLGDCLIKKFNAERIIAKLFVVMMAGLIVYYGQVYFSIGRTYQNRLVAINEAVKNELKVIYLDSYDYQDYLYLADPTGPERLHYFKIFYGIPSEYEIIVQENIE